MLLDADVQALNDVYEWVQLYYASTRMIKKGCHIKFPTLAPAGALFFKWPNTNYLPFHPRPQCYSKGTTVLVQLKATYTHLPEN